MTSKQRTEFHFRRIHVPSCLSSRFSVIFLWALQEIQDVMQLFYEVRCTFSGLIEVGLKLNRIAVLLWSVWSSQWGAYLMCGWHSEGAKPDGGSRNACMALAEARTLMRLQPHTSLPPAISRYHMIASLHCRCVH
jgi:hypothetical protein